VAFLGGLILKFRSLSTASSNSWLQIQKAEKQVNKSLKQIMTEAD